VRADTGGVLKGALVRIGPGGATTAPNGTFSVRVAPAGTYAMTVTNTGLPTWTQSRVVVRGGMTLNLNTVRIPAAPAAAVTTGVLGRIVDSSGLPVAGAVVTVGPSGPSTPGMARTATTDGVGEFSVAIAPGTYNITVRVDSYPDTVFTGVVVPADGTFDAGDLALLVPGGGPGGDVDPCIANPTAMGCPGYTGGDEDPCIANPTLPGCGGGSGYEAPVKWYKKPVTYVIGVPVLGLLVWGASKLFKGGK
jgi:hypothetical protein